MTDEVEVDDDVGILFEVPGVGRVIWLGGEGHHRSVHVEGVSQEAVDILTAEFRRRLNQSNEERGGVPIEIDKVTPMDLEVHISALLDHADDS